MQYSINGGRGEYNNWQVDGANMLDTGDNTTLVAFPSVDAIAEFTVMTSNYGAQYGRNGSGTIEVTTKSGTNEFHGDVYEFARNDFFNANDYFDKLAGNPRPSYKKHDFGSVSYTHLHRSRRFVSRWKHLELRRWRSSSIWRVRFSKRGR